MRRLVLIPLSILLLVFPLLMIPAVAVHAEPGVRIMEVAQIRETGTYLFTVGWDQGELSTTLVDPKGVRSPQDKPAVGVRVASRQGITIFRVENAAVGMWRAEFMEDNNGRVGTVVQRLIRPLTVQELTAKQNDKNAIDVRFTLEGEPGQTCPYEVFLTTDGDMENGRKIGSGKAKTGQLVEQLLTLSKVSSFSRYQVVVRAECTQGGFTDFDQAASPPFVFTAPGSPPPVEKLQAVSLPQGLEVQWTVPSGQLPEGFLVAAYGKDIKPYYAMRLDKGLTQAILPVAADAGTEIRVEVSLIASGLTGLPAVVTVDRTLTLEQVLGCVLPEDHAQLPGSLRLPYQVKSPISLLTDINRHMTEKSLTGQGTLSLVLPDGMNQIRWTARLSDSVSVAAERVVLSDSSAPVLRIYDDPDGRRVDAEQIELAGNADDAVLVSVNGTSVEKDTLNNFKAKVPLAMGDNVLHVEIADRAGNIAAYDARVLRQASAVSAQFPWFVLLALIPLALVFLMLRTLGSKIVLVYTLVFALLLSSVAGALSGQFPDLANLIPDFLHPKKTADSSTGIQARAALVQGDTVTAYHLVTDALRTETPLYETGQPVQYMLDLAAFLLLAARTALISGDLPAAGHYYRLLEEQPQEVLDQIPAAEQAKRELSSWSGLMPLKAADRATHAQMLAGTVQANVQKENETLPAVQEQVALEKQLNTYQGTFSQLVAQGNGAKPADWNALDAKLTELAQENGSVAGGSLALLADSLLAQDRPTELAKLLREGSPAALMELAARIASGDLPITAIPGDARVWLQDLAQALLGAAGGWNGPDMAGRVWAVLQLYLSEPLLDTEAAIRLLQETAVHFPDGTGLRELDRLLAVWEASLTTDTEHGALADLVLDHTGLLAILPDLLGKPDTLRPDNPVTPGLPPTPTPTPLPALPAGMDGTLVRDDYQPLFGLSAPEMTETGVIRFFVTMAAGSQGFPGGIPDASSFEFRTNVGFRRLLNVQSFTEVEAPGRYTMLLLDERPFIPAATLALQRDAALAYVRSMAADERALVVKGGIPYSYVGAFTDGGVLKVFGSEEMACHVPTSDKAKLEAAIMKPLTGDAFIPDMFSMVSLPVGQMTAIDPASASGNWATASLAGVQPWLGEVLVFTNGDPSGGVIAGGDQTIDNLRGAAIKANTAIHFVGVQPIRPEGELRALATAGRGEYINPATEDLLAFYSFIRERSVKVFLAKCAIPENPVASFFELWGRHVPTDVMAGLRRNPGPGMDLRGTAYYSDASLSTSDFADYTGNFEDLNPGADDGTTGPGVDPFEDPGTGVDLGFPGTVDDFAADTLAVYPPTRHSIPRSYGGLVLISLPGQGFTGLLPAQVNLTIPGLGRLQSSYIDVAGDDLIRFFMPVNLPSGLYTLNVTIAGQTFTFPDTFLLYDVDGPTSITFGPWIITSAGMQQADDDSGDWLLTGAHINEMVRFTDDLRISGDWLSAEADELTVTPTGDAVIVFDPDSDSLFVKEFFLEEGNDFVLGTWQPVTLERSGAGAAFSSRTWADAAARPLTLGFIDFPYDTGTLFPDKVEVPVLELGLDLPLQEFILMSAGIKNFSATSSALLTATRDSLDLLFEASLSSDAEGLKCFGALGIQGIDLGIDTAESRFSIGIEAELVPDKNIRATLAVKGVVFDEITLSIDVEIPVTTTPPSPVPVTITELGGSVQNLAGAFTGDPMGILGVIMVFSAALEAGDVVAIMPFVKTLPWLPADKVPPVLATSDTELSLTPWPFSLAFVTYIKLFDAFPVGQAELGIGFYDFNQTLLGINTKAVGLYAHLLVGPTIDFGVVRIGYNAGPSIDINNYGFFMQLQGGASAGINLGPIGFMVDLTGKFLIAIHDIEGSNYPQLAIIANAAPSVGIPGLWAAGTELDVRLLINEDGIRLIGLPSPLDMALEWLGDQIDAAATETWEAVTDGMDALGDAAGATWNFTSDVAVGAYNVVTEDLPGLMADGTAVVIQTGGAAVNYVATVTSNAFSSGASAAGNAIGNAKSGVTGFISKWAH